jgi:hypothetical protein
MIKNLSYFCKLKTIEECTYLKSQECPKTCNLGLDSQLFEDVDSEINDVLRGIENDTN